MSSKSLGEAKGASSIPTSSSVLSQTSSCLSFDSIWLAQPQGLITLSGCDNLHAQIIEQIPKTHKLRFQSLPVQHSFPDKKPARSFENYEPAGILKIGWIKKRLQVVPAVVVLLLEWLDGQDEINETNINNMYTQFKSNNPSRNVQILVVTVRHRSLAEEEPNLEDRIIRAGKKAGLDNKVFLLNTIDFKTSLRRLETQVWDLVCSFCRKEVQRTLRHRNKVDKKTQVKLTVRHHFKIGFYSELAQDSQTSLKHYQHCSTFLRQITGAKGELLYEVKWVSYILMVKICSFLIRLHPLHAALAYFQGHLSEFQNQSVFGQEMDFLEHDWSCSQYYAFGRLLQAFTSIRNLQYNPGYFYQSAAQFASKRKQSYLNAKKMIARKVTQRGGIPMTTKNRQMTHPDFVAQPCLLKDLLAPGSSVQRGQLVMESLLYQEQRVNHHEKVLEYGNKAYDCFKKERASNMYLHIAFQMGVEHFTEDKFPQAKRFFDRISAQYRTQGWYQLLTACLMYAYKCARRLALSREVLVYSFELMCTYAETTSVQKRSLLQDVFFILSDSSQPTAVPTPQAVGGNGKNPAPVTQSVEGLVVDVSRKNGLVTCDAEFLVDFQATVNDSDISPHPTGRANQLQIADCAVLVLKLTSNFPTAITFDQLEVVFSHADDKIIILHDDAPIPPDESKLRVFDLSSPDQLPPNLEATEGEEASTSVGSSSRHQPINRRVKDHLRFVPDEPRLLYIPITASHATDHLQAVQLLATMGPARNSLTNSTPKKLATNRTVVLRIPCVVLQEKQIKHPPAKLDRDGQELVEVSLQDKNEPEALETDSLPGDSEQSDPSEPNKKDKKDNSSVKLPAAAGQLQQVVLANGLRALPALRIGTDKPHAHVVMNQAPPALVKEYFPIQLTVQADVDHLTKATVGFSISGSTKEDTVKLYNQNVASGVLEELKDEEVPVPDLSPQETHSFIVYLYSSEVARLSVQVTLAYHNQHEDALKTLGQFSCEVRQPFNVSFATFGEPVHQLAFNAREAQAGSPLKLLCRPFIVQAEIENLSGHVISLQSVTAQLATDEAQENGQPYFTLSSAQQGPDLSKPQRLIPRERSTVLFQFRPERPCVASVGALQVQWVRERMKALLGSDKAEDENTSEESSSENELKNNEEQALFQADFPQVNICESPVKATINVPANCDFGNSFTLTVTVTNTSNFVQVLLLEVGNASKVCVSGLRTANLSLLPHSQQILKYTMTPLEVNFVSLPVISLQWSTGGRTVQLLGQHRKGRIFVAPIPKGQ